MATEINEVTAATTTHAPMLVHDGTWYNGKPGFSICPGCSDGQHTELVSVFEVDSLFEPSEVWDETDSEGDHHEWRLYRFQDGGSLDFRISWEGKRRRWFCQSIHVEREEIPINVSDEDQSLIDEANANGECIFNWDFQNNSRTRYALPNGSVIEVNEEWGGGPTGTWRCITVNPVEVQQFLEDLRRLNDTYLFDGKVIVTPWESNPEVWPIGYAEYLEELEAQLGEESEVVYNGDLW